MTEENENERLNWEKTMKAKVTEILSQPRTATRSLPKMQLPEELLIEEIMLQSLERGHQLYQPSLAEIWAPSKQLKEVWSPNTRPSRPSARRKSDGD
jgi:hypothetical protein